jgi:uncharacterized delta-60 repeat protein
MNSRNRGLFLRWRAGSALAPVSFVSIALLLAPALSPGLARSRSRFDGASQRMTPQQSGDLDPTFGNQGVVQISLSDSGTTPTSLAIQSNGQVVVGGKYGTLSTGSSTVVPHSFLLRLNADGSLDSTFGMNGVVMFNLNAGGDGIDVIKLQSDGKILFAGFVSDPSGGTDFMVGRANTDGTTDTSFGSNGFANQTGGTALCMDYQASDGEIVVGGTTSGNAGDVVALDSTGGPDPNYSPGTLLGGVRQLSSVTGVSWDTTAGGPGSSASGTIIVTGPALVAGLNGAQILSLGGGALGSGFGTGIPEPGPFVLGGGAGEIAWPVTAPFNHQAGAPLAVTTTLFDSTMGNVIAANGAGATLSDPNEVNNIKANAVSVYTGQAVSSGTVVLNIGSVLLGGSISSPDGSSSEGMLALLDTNLNFTDGTTGMIQYPQFTSISAVQTFSTNTNIVAYMAGTGAAASGAGGAGIYPSAPPGSLPEPASIARTQISGMPCSPPLNLDFAYRDGQEGPIYGIDPPPGEVGIPYAIALNVLGGTPPITGSMSGNVPPGMAFKPLTVKPGDRGFEVAGTLAGTPTTAGSYSLTFRVTDSRGCTFSLTETIMINGPQFPFIGGAASNGKNGVAVSGNNLVVHKSKGVASVTPQASKAVILINGFAQKTKAGPMGANVELIAPNGLRSIPPGATATIQVMLPTGFLTNSLVVTNTSQ